MIRGKTTIPFCVVMTGLTVLSSSASAQLPSGNWQYRWGDEFNDAGLDAMKWTDRYPWGITHNHQAAASPDALSFNGSVLTITATDEDYGGKSFTGGTISSGYSIFNVTTGYLEARIRQPSQAGSWTNFWMLQDGWPPELDIMEFPIRDTSGGSNDLYRYKTNYHWGTSSNHQALGTPDHWGSSNLSAGYHNYGVHWSSTSLTFYLDGTAVRTFSDSSAVDDLYSAYFILNYGVGDNSNWGGELPDSLSGWSNSGNQMRIDWVRVWQQASSRTTAWAYSGTSEYVNGWDSSSNWSNGVPNLGGVTATFDTVAPTEQRIDWSGIRTLSAINIDGATRYQIGFPDDRLLLAGGSALSEDTAITVAATSTAPYQEIGSQLELRSDVVIANHSSQPLLLSGQIRGGGEITLEGSGRVEMSNGGNIYTGDTILNSGALALTGSAGSLASALIDIHPGATLDIASQIGALEVSDSQVLANDGTVVGNVDADSGSVVSGRGVFLGDLVALSGSMISVGNGELGFPSRFVIDDFESYDLGNVRDVADPPWTAHAGTQFADIEDDAGNQVLAFGWSDSESHRGVSRKMPAGGVIDNTETATFFFRFNSRTDDPDHSFGLGDTADTSTVNYGDFEVQVRVADDPSASGTFMLDARDGDSFTTPLATALQIDSWYNVWMVVDQATDTYDVYMNTGTGNATVSDKLNGSPLAFRNGTSALLDRILGYAGPAPIDNGVQYDELVFLDGSDLTNPLGGLAPGSVVNPVMTVEGDAVLESGATLELEIISPAVLESFSVTNQLTAGGTLAIVLAPGEPLPQAGDAFDVIDAQSITGVFDQIDVETLGAGDVWDLRELYTSGVVSVLNADAALDECIACLTGPGNATLPGCESQDQDGDNDVDMYDYARMQECLSSVSGVLSAGCLADQ